MKHWARSAWLRFRSVGRVGWVAAAVFGGALVVMTAWALFSWEDSYPMRPLDHIAYLVCLAFAAACAVRAVRSARGRRRYGWVALVLAFSAWAVGEIIWAFEEVQDGSRFWHPSPDQGVLMVYPLGRTQARQDFRIAPGRGPPLDRHRALDAGVGTQPRGGPCRRGGRRRSDVGCPTAIRLQHHAGLRAHATTAGRRTGEVDRHLHAGASPRGFGAAP